MSFDTERLRCYRRALLLLASNEWGDELRCPSCSECEWNGHAPNCELAAVLNMAAGLGDLKCNPTPEQSPRPGVVTVVYRGREFFQEFEGLGESPLVLGTDAEIAGREWRHRGGVWVKAAEFVDECIRIMDRP